MPGEGGCYIQSAVLRFKISFADESGSLNFPLKFGAACNFCRGLASIFLRSHHDRCFFDSEICGFLAILLGDVSTNCSLDALGYLDGRF